VGRAAAPWTGPLSHLYEAALKNKGLTWGTATMWVAERMKTTDRENDVSLDRRKGKKSGEQTWKERKRPRRFHRVDLPRWGKTSRKKEGSRAGGKKRRRCREGPALSSLESVDETSSARKGEKKKRDGEEEETENALDWGSTIRPSLGARGALIPEASPLHEEILEDHSGNLHLQT